MSGGGGSTLVDGIIGILIVPNLDQFIDALADVLAVEDATGESSDHFECLVHASFNGSIHLRVPLSAQLLRGLQPEFVSGGISTIGFKPEGAMLLSLVWEHSPGLLIWAILEE
jgi:hypothetical protein